MKEYNKTRYFYIVNKIFHFRYGGWDRCFNVLPYIVVRANPTKMNWSDFSIECGWFLWAFGIRVEPDYNKYHEI